MQYLHKYLNYDDLNHDIQINVNTFLLSKNTMLFMLLNVKCLCEWSMNSVPLNDNLITKHALVDNLYYFVVLLFWSWVV